MLGPKAAAFRIQKRVLCRHLSATSSATMSAVAPARLAALQRLRCQIFQTSYNPTSVRTGAKYLRAPLRGPAMVEYYPKPLTVAQFNRWKGGANALKLTDWDEYQRLVDVEEKKRRGKGVPKKAKTKGQHFVLLASAASLNPGSDVQRTVAVCPGSGSCVCVRCAPCVMCQLCVHRYNAYFSPPHNMLSSRAPALSAFRTRRNIFNYGT